jgi:hypothetical protein
MVVASMGPKGKTLEVVTESFLPKDRQLFFASITM